MTARLCFFEIYGSRHHRTKNRVRVFRDLTMTGVRELSVPCPDPVRMTAPVSRDNREDGSEMARWNHQA
jgi:hypothetical protein